MRIGPGLRRGGCGITTANCMAVDVGCVGVRLMKPSAFLHRTRAIPRPERFVVAAVRPSEREMALRVVESSDDFCAVLSGGGEVTVVMPQEQWQRASALFLDPAVETDFRVITLSADLPMDSVGYVSVVTGALAETGVQAAVLSAYSFEHLLVRERDLARSLDVLHRAGAVAATGSSATEEHPI